MRTVSSPPLSPASEKQVNDLPKGGNISPGIHQRVARAIWPHKTAECWAAAAGKEPDVGKVWLRGKVSGDAKLALIRLLD